MEQRIVPVHQKELKAMQIVGYCCFQLAQHAQKSVASYRQCIEDCNECKRYISRSTLCLLCSCFDE